MRDLLILAVVLGSLPACFVSPYVGMLMWSWLSYMNPHRLAWGIAYDFPVVQVTAVATLAGLAFYRKRRSLPLVREVVLLAALFGIFTLSSSFAFYPDLAWAKWAEVSKSLLLGAVTIMVVGTAGQLRVLFWVIAVSIGFYGVKGGLFSFLVGGHYMILGPPDSAFGGNTSLGVVLNMCLPVFWYLAKTETRAWLKGGLAAAFGLSLLSVVFTYSRGAFLGLVSVLGVLMLQSRRKHVYAVIAALAITAFVPFVPEQWFERISTIRTYEHDASAMARLNEWRFAVNLALDRPLTGGGFKVYSQETYDIYLPEFGSWWDAHSVYFGMLAEHGVPGLVVFLLLVSSTLLGLRRLRRTYEPHRPEHAYCSMLIAALAGFLTSGAFLDVHYLDLFYQLVAAAVVLKRLRLEEEPVDAAAVTPDGGGLGQEGTTDRHEEPTAAEGTFV